MKKKINKVLFDDGTVLEYRKELYFNHGHYEEEIIKSLNIDIEDWAKIEYDLIDEEPSLSMFIDSDIYEECEYRGLFKDIQEDAIENVNIANESFLERFITIMNRGNNTEIENTLTELEEKFKIG